MENPEYSIKPSSHIDTLFVFRWKDLQNGFNAYCTSDIKELQKINKTNGEWWLSIENEIFLPDENNNYVIKVKVKEFEVLFTDEKRNTNDSTRRGDNNDYFCTVYVVIDAI